MAVAATVNHLDYLTKKVEFDNGTHGWVAKYISPQQSSTNQIEFICKTWESKKYQLTLIKTKEAIERYNKNRQLIPLSLLNKQAEIEFSDNNSKNLIIKQCELNWMIEQKPLIFDENDIIINLGKDESDKLFIKINEIKTKYKHINNFNEDIFGALAWNGVVSRWRLFCKFIETKYNSNNNNDNDIDNKDNDDDNVLLTDAKDALLQFGNTLGRVVSYRALALTQTEFDSVKFLNEIIPTGQLRASLLEIKNIINKHGVTRITVARLYISHLSEWIGLDPSLSLHDDYETALCIAQTYMNEKLKKYVYLFEMDVPKIMSIGFKVVDVQKKRYLVDDAYSNPNNNKNSKQKDRWFKHNNIWFDANNERTERQLLYSIPFLKQRCKSIKIFKSIQQLQQAIEPFRIKQQTLKDLCKKT